MTTAKVISVSYVMPSEMTHVIEKRKEKKDGELVVHRQSTHSWMPWLSTNECGHLPHDWDFYARFYAPTAGEFPWSQNYVQILHPIRWDYKLKSLCVYINAKKNHIMNI